MEKIKYFLTLNTESDNVNLFLDGFYNTLANQKKDIMEYCIDPIVNNLHVLETFDEQFVLLRGTNRNESLHRQINQLAPNHCSKELSEKLLYCFLFTWNVTH